MLPAIRLFKSGVIKTVKAIMCENAFFKYPKSDVEDWAEHYGIALKPGSNLVETLTQINQQYLLVDAKQALAFASRRAATLQDATQHCEAILELDEAINCLDIHDHQEVLSAQKKAANNLHDAELFVAELAEAHKKHSKHEKLKATSFPLLVGQHDVKQFAPPGARVWRGNIRAEWWGELKPYKCVWSSVDRAGSEREAIKAMLQQLWMLFNVTHGYPKQHCPVSGIFDVS